MDCFLRYIRYKFSNVPPTKQSSVESIKSHGNKIHLHKIKPLRDFKAGQEPFIKMELAKSRTRNRLKKTKMDKKFEQIIPKNKLFCRKTPFRNLLKLSKISEYTVKLARAKLPANAGNITCSSQVKRSLAQFTCVTCSLLVNTGKFTCFEAASTSRRTHANCLRAHVNLTEYHRHFTGSFTSGTHANLPATSMQNCLLLQAKIHATYRQKH